MPMKIAATSILQDGDILELLRATLAEQALRPSPFFAPSPSALLTWRRARQRSLKLYLRLKRKGGIKPKPLPLP